MDTTADAAGARPRGWLPLVSLAGQVLLVPLDAHLAFQVKRALSVDPFGPIVIAGRLEELLRSYVEEIVA